MWEQDDDDPNNPGNRDFDLSEAGIDYYRPDGKPWYLRRFVFLLVGIVLLTAMLLPLAGVF
jgi:hypothetical protein